MIPLFYLWFIADFDRSSSGPTSPVTLSFYRCLLTIFDRPCSCLSFFIISFELIGVLLIFIEAFHHKMCVQPFFIQIVLFFNSVYRHVLFNV